MIQRAMILGLVASSTVRVHELTERGYSFFCCGHVLTRRASDTIRYEQTYRKILSTVPLSAASGNGVAQPPAMARLAADAQRSSSSSDDAKRFAYLTTSLNTSMAAS